MFNIFIMFKFPPVSYLKYNTSVITYELETLKLILFYELVSIIPFIENSYYLLCCL